MRHDCLDKSAKRKAKANRLYKKLDYGINFEGKLFAQARNIFRKHFGSFEPVKLSRDAVARHKKYHAELSEFIYSNMGVVDSIRFVEYNNPRLTKNQRETLTERLLDLYAAVKGINHLLSYSRAGNAELAKRLFGNLGITKEDLQFMNFFVSDRTIVVEVSKPELIKNLRGDKRVTSFHETFGTVPVSVVYTPSGIPAHGTMLHENAHAKTRHASANNPNGLLQQLVNEQIAELETGKAHRLDINSWKRSWRSALENYDVSFHMGYYFDGAIDALNKRIADLRHDMPRLSLRMRRKIQLKRARQQLKTLEQSKGEVGQRAKNIQSQLITLLRPPYNFHPKELAQILRNIPAQKIMARLPKVVETRMARRKKKR